MSRITKMFENAKARGEGTLIGYLTGGDPSPEYTPKLAEALIKGGVDIIELGIPFSDPIADGPTIQAANVRALTAGTTPIRVLEIAQQLRCKHAVPIVILTYFNPVFRIGLSRFFKFARERGVDGVVVPDLPIEEANEYRAVATANEVDTVFLAAPSTSDRRLTQIVNASSGFLYLVSHYGVTGEKDSVSETTLRLIRRVKRFCSTRIPLAVGFGVSKKRQVTQMIQAGADGVIVGSAFVRIVADSLQNPACAAAKLEDAARSLKDGAVLKTAEWKNA